MMRSPSSTPGRATALALALLLAGTAPEAAARTLAVAAEGSLRYALSAASPFPGVRSVTDTIPPDTYADPAARHLVERAREARELEVAGIESFEARVWERAYAGLSGSRFRRERALWVMERAAHVRWEADGSRTVRWEGAFQAVPVAGQRSDQDPAMARSLAGTLSSLTGGGSPVFYHPGQDRIFLGQGEWVQDPLAPTGPEHYRFASGDTLRLFLPSEDRTIVLAEVQVLPRRSDPRLVAGSLWFDEESAVLVRAVYRPARPFNLGMDTDDPDVPRFFRSIEAEIRQVSMDYGFHHFQWWLPYRFAVEVEVRAGRLITLPFVMEWSMEDYDVNAAPSPELDPEAVPEGWGVNDRMVAARGPDAAEGDSVRLVTLVPPADSLHLAPQVEGADARGRAGGAWAAFDERELEGLRERLERMVPQAPLPAPRLSWGIQDGLVRFNRVEGLSVGAAGEAPLGRTLSGRAEVRLPTAVWMPQGELRLRRGPQGHQESLAVYRRLAHTSDWADPLNLSASVSALVGGGDRGEYYRAQGVELELERRTRAGEVDVRLFAESHRAVERNTNFHLMRWIRDDTLRTNLVADEGSWYGGSVGLRAHRGVDPEALRLFGQTRGEVASGPDGWYQRLRASTGFAVPAGPVEVALEGGVGRGWGELPAQRHFFLGGPATVRGVRPASMVGESFWFARAEVARARPAFRLAAFGDLGWAGPWDEIRTGRPVETLGLGLSIMDGLLRVDLARSLDRAERWWLHFYLDGLL